MMLHRVPRAVALWALLVALCCLRAIDAQAFTMPSLSDLPALPGLLSGLGNSITSGTPCPPRPMPLFPEAVAAGPQHHCLHSTIMHAYVTIGIASHHETSHRCSQSLLGRLPQY
jgi:hypothetical protein